MAKIDKNKNKKIGDIRKLKAQYPFLYFVAHNSSVQQTKDVLILDITKEQYTLLRELAVNEIANNLPAYHTPKKKKELKSRGIIRLKRLAAGKLKQRNLGPLFPLLRIICQDVIVHHGLESKKAGHRSGGRMAEDDKGQQV